MVRPTASAPLPSTTKVLSVGLDPRVLDYSRLPAGIDEEAFTARIEAAHTALREAGFDVRSCLIGTAADDAEAAVREALRADTFGLAMIGGGVRMMPEHTVLFERLVNLLVEEAPGIRLCFNSAPENTVETLRRWIGA
ncbi:hypothetical protein [Streptomyces sp. NPDC020489]|uniref:hypothetical protein n=1 Tax=Streptomyces sp. NPDC020489 TaxID=3365077 RepID=UPI0037B6AC20